MLVGPQVVALFATATSTARLCCCARSQHYKGGRDCVKQCCFVAITIH